MSTTPSITLPTETLSNEQKQRFSLIILREHSPPKESIANLNSVTSTLYLQEENNSSRSFSSGYSGGYYSSGENLNGGGSRGFSQSGGAHHNFYGRVDRLR